MDREVLFEVVALDLRLRLKNIHGKSFSGPGEKPRGRSKLDILDEQGEKF